MKKWIHVVITIALMFLFRFIPAPEPITPFGMQLLGVFLGGIYGWSTCGLVWPSLLAMLALGMTDYGTVAEVFAAGFGQANLILMLVSFIWAGPIMEAGLGDYLAIKLLSLKFVKGRPWLFMYVLFVGVSLLSQVINGIILIIFILTVFGQLFKKLGYEKGDKTVAMFNVGVVSGIAIGMSILPFMGWALGPLAVAAGAGVNINMGTWIILATVMLLVTMLFHVLLMKLMGCNVEPLANIDPHELDPEGKFLNGLSRYQSVLLKIVVGTIIACVAATLLMMIPSIAMTIYKCDVYGIFLISMVVMLLVKVDGKPLMNIAEAAKSISWDMIFLYAIALTISNALTADGTGVAEFVTIKLTPLLANTSEYFFVLLVVLITLVLTNVANNMVVTFTMLSVVLMLFQQGVVFNLPLTVVCITVVGLLGFALPSASIYGAMLHSTEMNTAKSATLSGIMACVSVMLAVAIVVIPMGMFML
ncbi:MAG: anion permease [Peptococcaceae bacterium]|nr:anion permease [Peptococcaceae bacterium]